MAQNVARVWNTGTPEEPIFNFELPSGAKGEPGGWNVGTNLGTTDLDTVVTPGLYWNGSTNAATNAALHYPPMTDPNGHGTPRGTLQVQSWSGGNAVIQTYTRLGSGGDQITQRPRTVFQRYKSGGWSEWSIISPTKFTPDANGHRVLQTWDDEGNNWVSDGPGGLPDPIQMDTAIDLNTLRVSGSYSNGVSANVAQNYPVSGLAGFLQVRRINNNAALIEQEWRPFAHTQVSSNWARGTYVRMMNSNTWSPWRFVSSQRVDQTAGRVIYTWDDLNNREQMIYGDTGWRDISANLITDNFVLNPSQPRCQIRREGNEIALVMRLQASASLVASAQGKSSTLLPALDVPVGFTEGPISYSLTMTGIAHAGASIEALGIGPTHTNTQLRIAGTTDKPWTTNAVLGFNLRWKTNAPWPTTLPGTAA